MQLKDDPEAQLINSQLRTPILDWKQIKELVNTQAWDGGVLESVKEWILTNSNIGEHGFAFRLLDKSMYPRFDQDTIIIVNSERSPGNNDFVIAYLKETDDIIFRQYELENGIVSLKPINTSMYKIVVKNDCDLIIGVMVEARWQV